MRDDRFKCAGMPLWISLVHFDSSLDFTAALNLRATTGLDRLGHRENSTQRVVHRFGRRESRVDLGIEENKVRTRPILLRVLAADPAVHGREIVLAFRANCSH